MYYYQLHNNAVRECYVPGFILHQNKFSSFTVLVYHFADYGSGLRVQTVGVTWPHLYSTCPPLALLCDTWQY